MYWVYFMWSVTKKPYFGHSFRRISTGFKFDFLVKIRPLLRKRLFSVILFCSRIMGMRLLRIFAFVCNAKSFLIAFFVFFFLLFLLVVVSITDWQKVFWSVSLGSDLLLWHAKCFHAMCLRDKQSMSDLAPQPLKT